MSSELLVALLTALGGALIGGATIWQAVRKTGPEIAKVEAETGEIVVQDIYEPIVGRLRNEVEELRKSCAEDKALLTAQLQDFRKSLESERSRVERIQTKLDEVIEGEVLRQIVRGELERHKANPDPAPVVIRQPESEPVPVTPTEVTVVQPKGKPVPVVEESEEQD